jgi:hypothetical protein
VDRADIVQFVDLPPAEAIYMIIRTCALELMNRGLIQPFVSQAKLYDDIVLA